MFLSNVWIHKKKCRTYKPKIVQSIIVHTCISCPEYKFELYLIIFVDMCNLLSTTMIYVGRMHYPWLKCIILYTSIYNILLSRQII